MNRLYGTFLLILTVTLFIAAGSSATQDYAAATGVECHACHVDPLGGGELTERGKGYLLSLSPEVANKSTSRTTASRFVQLFFGYIHIITAFLWFGTILYVHLVLKPAYASAGMPRGEVKVGLVSMAIMAITGIVLTYYKVPSFHFFVDSRFGILLLAKIVLFSLMVISALYVVFFIGPRLKGQKKTPTGQTDKITLSGLAHYDGQENRPAYFSYKGKIYDVSRSKLWKDGNHMQRHQAGVDLTKTLSQAPHGEEKVLAMLEVGSLVDDKEDHPEELHKKIFFFMAYMNLAFVFTICLILALWRWH